MTPDILPNGTLVQIISTAEFDSFPCNSRGNAILGKEPDGSDDVMDHTRRPLCGCIAKITGFWHSSFPYYLLELVDASTAADPEFVSNNNCFGLSGFSRNEFHILPDPSLAPSSQLSFDDLLKGSV